MKTLIFTLLLLASFLSNVYTDEIFEIRIGKIDPVDGWDKMHHEGQDIWISPDPAITTEMVSSAEYKWAMPYLSEEEITEIKKLDPDVHLSQNATERHIEIIITFTDQGAKKQSSLTDENTGNLMVFMFDGEILTAPRIMDKISGDVAVLTGGYTEDKAKMITKALNQK